VKLIAAGVDFKPLLNPPVDILENPGSWELRRNGGREDRLGERAQKGSIAAGPYGHMPVLSRSRLKGAGTSCTAFFSIRKTAARSASVSIGAVSSARVRK
jgi:hypothetical protein